MTVDTSKPRLNRRQFLKLAGATGALAVPALAGYDLLQDARGEFPPSVSPYAPVDVLEAWPSHPTTTTSSPILLLTNDHADNPFGPYLAEILRAEGLNCFQMAPLSAINDACLERFDLILLAEGPLNTDHAETLGRHVAKGGGLVAMRPDVCLASLFGVERVSGSTAEGYLRVVPDHPIGQGIATETLQFHGDADHYRLAGAQAVAWLGSDRDTRIDFPAVTIHRYGEGQTALWAFDLARSVAYTRQGNPAWANQERDGADFIRASDMFVGWVDLERLSIPQADEQQRLLANLLTAMSQGGRPLPRLWYFPGAVEGMLVATGDAHQNPAFAVEDVLTRVEKYGGHMSIYYLPPLYKDWRRVAQKARWLATDLSLMDEAYLPSPSQIADWRARGHEFGLHPEVAGGLEADWRRYWEGFTGLGYGPVSPTTRTHCVLWTGWVETARLQASCGMRMNLDYYHWGPAFCKESGEWVYGHFTGSGLPMKLVDEQGRILNVYQQLTQLTDGHLLDLHWGGQAKLGAGAALEVSRALLRRSLAGDYCAIAANFHVDPFALGGEFAAEAVRWFEGTLDYAAAQGIPIWSAAEWLHFTEVRHDATFVGIQWHPATRRLGFQLVAQATPDVELTVMVPLWHGEARLAQVEVDGRPVKHSERKVGRVNYGWVSIEAGSHQVVATYA